MGWFGRVTNYIPVVGHVKGVYHLFKGDEMSAKKAFRDATVGTLGVALTVATLHPAVGIPALLKLGVAKSGAAAIVNVAVASATTAAIISPSSIEKFIVKPLAYATMILIGYPSAAVATTIANVANYLISSNKTDGDDKLEEEKTTTNKNESEVEDEQRDKAVESSPKREAAESSEDNNPPLSSASGGGDKDPYTPPPAASHQSFQENRIYSMTLKQLIDLLKEKIKEIHQQSRDSNNSDDNNRKYIRKLFREMYCFIIDAIIRCGATLSLDVNDDLVINDPNNQDLAFLTIERSVTEYDRIDIPEHFYMDFEINRILETNSFVIPNGDTFCPRILQVDINSSGVWRLLPANCSTRADVIYGIRCRLCPGRGTIKYVGQNRVNDRGRKVYNLHNRICCGHRSYLEKKIKIITGDDQDENEGEFIEILIDLDDYDDGDEKEILLDKKKKKLLSLDTDIEQELYIHGFQHHCLGKYPNKVKAKFAFREIFDVILLPTGRSMTEARSPAQVRRSWEIFWQWIFRARDTRGGHSKR